MTRLRALLLRAGDLPRRLRLTVRHHGPREAARRLLTAPTRLRPGARVSRRGRMRIAEARRWYARHGRPVLVVVPSHGPPRDLPALLRSIRRTTRRLPVRVVVCDDGSSPADRAALRSLAHRHGAEVVLGERQAGFAANGNRGLRRARPDEDVVLLNSDVVCGGPWVQALQHAAHERGPGIAGARLLYPDGTIQHGGVVRNADAPAWFDHRYRFRRPSFPAADEPQPALAVTGACLYVAREALAELGELDEGFGMAYEDVDYCLRAWAAGRPVSYEPAATLTHHESRTRGTSQGEREIASQRRFWDRWGAWLDHRDVRAPDGGLRIVYLTQDTGVGGGHRVIYTHLNALADRGHHPELWTLADDGPDWFDLRVPVRRFADYDAALAALAPLEAIKVATWWRTAPTVWRASIARGIAVHLVQDVETTYYDDPLDHGRVLATYQPEHHVLAGCAWIADELRALRMPDVTTLTPGLDLARYAPRDVPREEGSLLAVGRSHPIKNFALTRDAYLALPAPRPRLRLFGAEPDLTVGLGDRVEHHHRPSDEAVVELYSRAGVVVQTSRHEGFCLPALEAMACGATVVCTDMHGNRDFCVDGVNCLMPAAEPGAVAAAIERALGDTALRDRLRAEGRATAERFAWSARLDQLEAWYRDLADRYATPTTTVAEPTPQRGPG